MAQVIHTVKVQYGSYSDTTTILCDENDDNDVIKAKVRKKLDLNFLSMAYYSVKVIDTRYVDR